MATSAMQVDMVPCETAIMEIPSQSLHLSSSNIDSSVHVNYLKIIRSINADNIIDIFPSVIKHIETTTKKVERLELIQEVRKVLERERNMNMLVENNILPDIINSTIELFDCEQSQSVQFELMSIICLFPQSHLTEKTLSRLHGAAQSSSPLIRRQSLVLVMKTVPIETSVKFLLAFLDDDDSRVRSTSVQNLAVIVSEKQSNLPMSFYFKIIESLSDTHDEVRLRSVEIVANMAFQHKTEHVKIPGCTSRQLTVTQHAFMQLCMLMCDTSTAVRIKTAAILGRFTEVDAEFLIQTLDKKMKPHMKVVPEGAKIKQEFSAGRIWGGDAPIKSTAGEVNIINPASCGAFVHGMEDEFSAVRQNTVRSICELSMSCQEFSEVAIPHLIDMLNDEIQSVRLLTISSLQKITQNVELYEDQLETVLSVLEESNVEIRQSLHKLLSTARLNTQTSVRRVLKGLLDNLKKYPQDCNSVYRCVRGVGDNNAVYAALLAPELLSKHPYLYQTEPNTDDNCYIATMILVFNAAKHNPIIMSMFHEYTPRHYIYIAGLLPDLVPHLPQVYNQEQTPASSYNLQYMLDTLNTLLHRFVKLSRSQDFKVLQKITDDIMKIRKLSSAIRYQSSYLISLLNIFLKLFKLRFYIIRSEAPCSNRIKDKVSEIIADLCQLGCLFRGGQTEVIALLMNFYTIQFFMLYVPDAQVSEKELEAFRSHVIEKLKSSGTTIPSTILDGKRFNIFKWLESQCSAISADITMSTATVLSPTSNTEHVHEFPSHLSLSLHLEAETTNITPRDIAVKIVYPGSRISFYQPHVDCTLQDYYESTVFVGEQSWSNPGLLRISLVLPYSLKSGSDAIFRRLYGKDKVWVDVSDVVMLKIHPKTPK